MTDVGWTQILVFLAVVLLAGASAGDVHVIGCSRASVTRCCARSGGWSASSTASAGVDGREQAMAGLRRSPAGFQRARACSSPTRIQRLQHLLPLNPQRLGPVEPLLGLQHRRELRHQHQLARLRRRDDHELPHPDGRPRLAQLHLGRGRLGGRGRARPRPDAPRRGQGARGRSATSGSTSPAARCMSFSRRASSSPSCSSPRGSFRESRLPTSWSTTVDGGDAD